MSTVPPNWVSMSSTWARLFFAIHLGGKEPVIQELESVGFRIDVHAVDQADAFDEPVRIVRVLAAHQGNLVAVLLIEHRIIEEDVAPLAGHELALQPLPEVARREATGFEKALHVVVREASQMLGQVRAGVIDLAIEQKLTVKLRCDFRAFFTSI